MASKDDARVSVQEGRLYANGYSTRLVISHFESLAASEMDAEFDKCLSLGVSVAEVAAPVLTVDFVRREFEGTVIRQDELMAPRAGL